MKADRSDFYRRPVDHALPWRHTGRGKDGKIRYVRAEDLDAFREQAEAGGLPWDDLDTLYRHARLWADSEDDHDRRKAQEALHGWDPCPRCSRGDGGRGAGRALRDGADMECRRCGGWGTLIHEPSDGELQGWLYVAWHKARGWTVKPTAQPRPTASEKVPSAVTVGDALDDVRSRQKVVEAAAQAPGRRAAAGGGR